MTAWKGFEKTRAGGTTEEAVGPVRSWISWGCDTLLEPPTIRLCRDTDFATPPRPELPSVLASAAHNSRGFEEFPEILDTAH